MRKNHAEKQKQSNHTNLSIKKHRKGKLGEYLKAAPFDAFTPERESIMELGMGGPETLQIPGFREIEGTYVSRRYELEKKKIEKIYRNKDFVEVTLQQLAK
ncbi:MAG: hypothetical protein V4487_07905 [Chlamydiota bacterium]